MTIRVILNTANYEAVDIKDMTEDQLWEALGHVARDMQSLRSPTYLRERHLMASALRLITYRLTKRPTT